jgi:hypothetical protein
LSNPSPFCQQTKNESAKKKNSRYEIVRDSNLDDT